jgi:Leucine-rich repeat (LRR) protein
MKKNILILGIVFQSAISALLLNGMEENIEPEYRGYRKRKNEMSTNHENAIDIWQKHECRSLKSLAIWSLVSNPLHKTEENAKKVKAFFDCCCDLNLLYKKIEQAHELLIKSHKIVGMPPCTIIQYISVWLKLHNTWQKSVDFKEVSSWPQLIECLAKNGQNVDLAKRQLKEFSCNGLKKSLPKNVITSLDLSKNNLTMLSDDFNGLPNLKLLDLSNNKIENLPNSLWSLSALEFLHISNNPLEKLSANIIKLQNIKELYVSNTDLACLPNNIGRLDSLELLNITSNRKMYKLPVGQDFFSGLEVLYIAHTPIENIEEVVKDLKNIENLYLTSEQVASLTIEKLPRKMSINIV